MSGKTVTVQSLLEIRLEVGLIRGDGKIASGESKDFQPGPKYRAFQVHRGLNEVPADIWREWYAKNKRILLCLKDGSIQTVTTSQSEVAA